MYFPHAGLGLLYRRATCYVRLIGRFYLFSQENSSSAVFVVPEEQNFYHKNSVH